MWTNLDRWVEPAICGVLLGRVRGSAILQIDEEYVQKSRREVDMMMEKHRRELEILEKELEANMNELTTLQVWLPADRLSNQVPTNRTLHIQFEGQPQKFLWGLFLILIFLNSYTRQLSVQA